MQHIANGRMTMALTVDFEAQSFAVSGHGQKQTNSTTAHSSQVGDSTAGG